MLFYLWLCIEEVNSNRLIKLMASVIIIWWITRGSHEWQMSMKYFWFHCMSAVVVIDYSHLTAHLQLRQVVAIRRQILLVCMARVDNMVDGLLLPTVVGQWFGKTLCVHVCMTQALTCREMVKQGHVWWVRLIVWLVAIVWLTTEADDQPSFRCAVMSTGVMCVVMTVSISWKLTYIMRR